MEKFAAGIFAAAVISILQPANVSAQIEVPEDIYTWVQSTARGDYWFNHQQTGYFVDENGTIDLNIIIAPTICIYDEIQIQDVVQKRRWRMLPGSGYNNLIGRADYFRFDLTAGTVQIIERVDLDKNWAELDKDTSGKPIKLSELSGKDVTCRFYRAILAWAKEHNKMMIDRSWGNLSESDSKLKPEDMPIAKIPLPAGDEFDRTK